MGNCMDLRKPVAWVDDDDFWGAMGQNERITYHGKKTKDPVLEEKRGGGAGSRKEIKIKISKKQLEELLLQRAEDGKELAPQQVLADLLSMGEFMRLRDVHEYHDVHFWRPKLQTIPE
ncbi:hypothetical protein Cni_G23933 [Canna indica]|uniref:Uncharacterized protein n=1 Tax=Canna indica TaxID=4628 RepID=A0AAQ3L1C4_9LILI|nr:hypothetical protein Cni_G23933 [Canna indica]